MRFNPESPSWLEKRSKRSPRDLHKLKYTHWLSKYSNSQFLNDSVSNI